MEEPGSAVVEEHRMYMDQVVKEGFDKRWGVVQQHFALHVEGCTVGLAPIVCDSLHMLKN